jgi:hypothetical protein
MEIKIKYGTGLLIVVILAVLVLFVLPYGGGLVYSIMLNTILGFIAIFLLNAIFGLDIKYDLLVFIFVAIFGLFAVAVLVILNLLMVSKKQKR